MTKEELKTKYKHYLSVGELKKFIAKHKIPDNAKVLVQQAKEGIKDDVYLINAFEIEEYAPAWSCVKYNDEDDILFLDIYY